MIRNFTELATFLRGLPDNDDESAKHGFDMKSASLSSLSTTHPCGSAACIGGWVRRENKIQESVTLDEAVFMIAPSNVSRAQCELLCFPSAGKSLSPSQANLIYEQALPQQAARAVEILADTGECDWQRAMEEA